MYCEAGWEHDWEVGDVGGGVSVTTKKSLHITYTLE